MVFRALVILLIIINKLYNTRAQYTGVKPKLDTPIFLKNGIFFRKERGVIISIISAIAGIDLTMFKIPITTSSNVLFL